MEKTCEKIGGGYNLGVHFVKNAFLYYDYKGLALVPGKPERYLLREFVPTTL